MGRLSHYQGQGDHGRNAGPAGDLNITVSVRPDPLFERDGYNVLCEVPADLYAAALGDEVVVPTIDGKVKYTVPEGNGSRERCSVCAIKEFRMSTDGAAATSM